ncbi:hypothetical protein ABT300_44085, partial [Streptomyces sp. NPDC001027]|uniref:hypothetical protein n=1 Tax=Streptomyces sp. NPDC001027 TaxID=3154771 RepID=UPI00331D0925
MTHRRRRDWRRAIGSGAIAVALLGGAVPAIGFTATPAFADEKGAASAKADTTPESKAGARAAKTGERVEVTAKTSESTQLFANPDGTFTQEMNAAPVRAQ